MILLLKFNNEFNCEKGWRTIMTMKKTPATAKEKKATSSTVKETPKSKKTGYVAKTSSDKTKTKAQTKTKSAVAKTKAKPKSKNDVTKEATVNPIKTKIYIEFNGAKVLVDDIINNAKLTYKSRGGSDNIKTLNLYVKPDENAAYFVINGELQNNKMDVYFC